MANSTGSSPTGESVDALKFFLLVSAIFSLGRLWLDVFILAVICRDWMKKKRLSTTDKILTLQGSLRICLGCMMIIWFILEKLCPWIEEISHVRYTLVFWFWYFVSYDFWLTASLCSFYCVKIADFSHPFFVHLKLRLPRLESAWLFGSAVLALGSGLPFVCRDFQMQDNRNISDFFQNKNVTDNSHTVMVLPRHIKLGVGYFAAFSICATSAALLLFSLWRHRQRMQGSWGDHRSPQTDAHLQALVTILSLLINNVIVFVSVQVLLTLDYEKHSVYHLVASVILYSSFSVESLILIWGNKKLRNEFCGSLHFAKCRGCVR